MGRTLATIVVSLLLTGGCSLVVDFDESLVVDPGFGGEGGDAGAGGIGGAGGDGGPSGQSGHGGDAGSAGAGSGP